MATAITTDSIKKGLIEQKNVIHALLMREVLTSYGQRTLGFVWVFIEPVLHILILLALHHAIGKMGPYGIDYTLFVISGIIPYFLFRNSFVKVMNSYNANKGLLVFSKVKIFDIYIARGILEFSVYLLIFCFLVTGCYYLGFTIHLKSILGVIYFLFATVFLGMGMGFVFAPVFEIFPSVQVAVNFINRVLYLSSGIFYTINTLPANIQNSLQYNPVVLVIEGFRHQMFTEYSQTVVYHQINNVWFVIGFLWMLGLIMRKNTFFTQAAKE